MKTIIRSLATANPDLYVTQAEALSVFEKTFALSEPEANLYRKILTHGAIQGRFIGMHTTAEAGCHDPDELIARFLKHGREIATRAAREALEKAEIKPADVGGLVVNTCTGYLCPGLSSYVAEQLGLEPYIKLSDLMGMGCGAAIPNLEAGFNMLSGCSVRPVLSIAVEICSATLFVDPDPGQVVSNCIFGDGAAAAVIQKVNGQNGHGLFRLVDFESGLFPEYREHLRYRTDKHRLRNVLSPSVPAIGARACEQVIRRLLARHHLTLAEVDWWAVHPGGTRVLESVARRLGLNSDQLRFSYEILSRYGNMSSPSVLFVVNKILMEGRPRPGDKGILVSFGAGFAAHALLVEFE